MQVFTSILVMYVVLINWKYSTSVPQENVFAPFLYLLYTVDILTNNYTMPAIFGDDTAIMTTDEHQQTVTD